MEPWRPGANAFAGNKPREPPASTLWQGNIQVHWHHPLEEPEKQKGSKEDLPWQDPFSLQVLAKAVHPYETMPSKLRVLPSGPQAPQVIVRMVALDVAPTDIQTAARMYLDPVEPRELEPSCVVLQPAVTVGKRRQAFEETCMKSLRAQPGRVLAMELPPAKPPLPDAAEGVSEGPSGSETLYFIPTPLPPPNEPSPPDAPMLACVNGSPAHVAVGARWDPRKQPKRGALAKSLPPAPPHFQPEKPQTLHELESERRRLQAELVQLQKASTSSLQHFSWREDDPLVELETKEDVLMKELASIFGKILNQEKLEKAKAGGGNAAETGRPSGGAARSVAQRSPDSTAAAVKKEKRAHISWYDGGAFGPQDGNGDASSAMQQHGLGLKRQAQQRNEGCSAKVSRILELEEAAAQKRKKLGNGAPQWLAVREEDAEEDEDIKYWMGVLGPGNLWADMGPLGIDRGLLEALQSKVVLPGGLRAAAVVCLWRAAGYEHHIRTGTSNSTADAAQAGNLGSRGDKAGLGGGEPEGLREGVSEAGGVHLMPGFQLPVRKKIRSVPRPSPEAQPCRYSIQEVLADEGLASQLASLGPQLPRLVYREMKGTKLLYLFPKQQLAPESKHAANLGRMLEFGMEIRQASKPVSASMAYTGTQLTYDVIMVPDQMAIGDPNRWLVKDLRGWLMTPVRVKDDRHFMSECLLAIEQANKAQQHELQQDEQPPQVFVRLGLPQMELYPMGVQLVLNARTWLQSPAMQLAQVCALLAAGAHLHRAHLYPRGAWCIRMRRCHIEQVVATGSSEAVAVLRLAWEAGMLLPLQQEEMASNRAYPIPLLVRDTLKVAIHQRRAARFFITAYPMPVPQELLKPKQEQAKQQLAELMQNPQINIPCQTDEEDSELAAHAGITPSILHGSIPEVQQFLHILLGGQAV
mmetsp:Transcript_4496/g.12261  ORF Transcript_4496/g.12261 Transcript_4496/m.12261 type:complete len:921 (-) Transcript_4496:868-3630(-)|eukprot:CAMPEP_0202380724 /NCGR_PEP_ID=MMETSP1127-20130417/30605_1 /ASSEMBLY_ACC=CAM_ASM_000462 /TAXON_ID=3047 /ORGANISM="Dunaliella tertiolecta, Strain CCMP1320" /LENGTH=920 /DNA_ID=CAMNT_0048979477 /DNA_START=132 /DNA_END=2894 /DNA_ORIENTATION=-